MSGNGISFVRGIGWGNEGVSRSQCDSMDCSLEMGLPVRQYRHQLNPAGDISSVCAKCRVLIANETDEWLLLERERRHVCCLASLTCSPSEMNR
jgi:hypothetical protein